VASTVTQRVAGQRLSGPRSGCRHS
jgi:hypothetical protein